MGKKLILVVDYGTSNVRVNAINTEDGKIACSSSRKYKIVPKMPGYAEISAYELWRFSVECMAEVLKNITEQDEICAIGYSFFGDNLIPVDEKGNALNDCILCTDIRGKEEAEFINRNIPEKRQIEIIGAKYGAMTFGAKLLWVKKNMPEIANKIAYFDSQQQFVFRKLGLKPVNDYTMAARKQLLNIGTMQWSEEFLDTLGVSEKMLGTDIVASGDIVGYIRQYGEIEFPKSIPVIAGGHDCDVAMIGMGVIDETQDLLGDITGTFDHVGYMANGAVNLKRENPDCPLTSYSGSFKDTSICLGAFPTAGAIVEWFMREIQEGTKETDYEKYWKAVRFDGKGSVMVHPTIAGDRGVIEGIGYRTSKEDIFKAVIEAVTFENRRLIDDCREVKTGGVNRLRIGGGAANSDEWMQLRADISGMRIERMRNIQISSVGAAVLGAAAVGIYPDVKTAVEKMVHVEKIFKPTPGIREKYEEKYREYLRRMGYC
ncbi:hypothetical protein H8S37_11375 [Mediterraneibacter sp. NSJ-55]|uniref:Carbohydrate kinase n=1 Tax=Mediterraneibacter hominis TaxID=2763054 RepID=A0A923RQF4_9FIRM|nr:FGGY family carbohydrate kinase [Mediterraneibacter hominis]MBC5689519.1 hypothetical protein [Mediterraneibacter hominis]